MQSRWLLIEGGDVIDGNNNPVERGASVLVEDNRIVKIGADVSREDVPRGDELTIIDARGKTVMPGMIDAHVHMTYGEARTEEEIDIYTPPELRTLIAARNLSKVLRGGVTSFSQPGGSYFIGVGLREGIARGLIHGPRMTSAGRYLTTSNGLTDWFPDSVGVPEGSIGKLTNSAPAMVDEIRRQAKGGVDLIKMADSPFGDYQAFSDDEMKIVAETAHRLKLKTTIHARGSDEVGAAVDAGIDWIMHGNMMSDEVIDKLARAQTPLVPTLLMLANHVDFAKIGKVPRAAYNGCARLLDATADSLHRAHEAGVKFAMGTDTGFAVAPYGEWHGRELELLCTYAGLSPLEAIQAGTAHGAPMVNLEGEVGQVKVGMLADLLVVDGDPSVDISLMSDPDNFTHIILDGVVQEFEEDIRSQRYHNNHLPNQYSWETLTHSFVNAGGEERHWTDVSWSKEQEGDIVADVRRDEITAADEAGGRLGDDGSARWTP